MTTEIIFEVKPKSVVDLYGMRERDFVDKIVAYETKPHSEQLVYKGLGLLVQCSQNSYGFVYHRTLLKGQRTQATFKGTTRFIATKNALEAGRRVFMFKSFEEFLTHAAEYANRY